MMEGQNGFEALTKYQKETKDWIFEYLKNDMKNEKGQLVHFKNKQMKYNTQMKHVQAVGSSDQ